MTPNKLHNIQALCNAEAIDKYLPLITADAKLASLSSTIISGLIKAYESAENYGYWQAVEERNIAPNRPEESKPQWHAPRVQLTANKRTRLDNLCQMPSRTLTDCLETLNDHANVAALTTEQIVTALSQVYAITQQAYWAAA